jgi:peptidoglycan/xylan/chitin deacetylase (PgdA/CDA1 family)/glycosyltransferase involved in cell wall biosynthesis
VRFSIVIPTYQRRDLALAAVRALESQELRDFEAIVVVDGSADGTAQALRGLQTSFPLAVHEQPNAGAASARNRGAAAARGEILLFLDDDMEAHPRLLLEHDRSHREGAEVVLGHIPLHPDSPRGMLSRAVGSWAESRARKLSEPGAELTFYDLLTGQISLRRDLFRRLGGFDDAFTRGGTYGDEDLDFGQRLLDAGCRIVFNPEAVSWQRYVVTPQEHLLRWRQTGRADVLFARKHPHRAEALFQAHGAGTAEFRRLFRPVLEIPGLGALLAAVLRLPILFLASRAKGGSAMIFRWFRRARTLEYWRGVREAGGIPRPRPLRVLAWHSIADLAGDPVLEPYAVPADRFRDQLRALRRAGYRPVGVSEAVRFLEGRGGLPRRPVLLTFDDAYEDLAQAALPALEEHGAPAVAFAVSGRLGGTNEWDRKIGARALPLLDAAGLRELSERGIEIGAHSRTHPVLTRVPDAEIDAEIAGSRQDLERLGLPAPRLFAYPYGVEDERVRRAAQGAGFTAAFTVSPGLVRPGQDPYRLPRIEVLRGDSGWRLLWKLARAR